MSTLDVYENGKFTVWSEEERKSKGFPDQDDGEEFEDYLVRIGIDPTESISVGIISERYIQIYNGRLGYFMAYVEFKSVITPVLIWGIGSLLMFLKEYESVFEIKGSDFVEAHDGSYIRKDMIGELSIHGDYKKDTICELIAYDRLNNNPTVLLKNSREYIGTRLKEDFNIIT